MANPNRSIEVFEEGADANADGLPILANPYVANSENYIQWEKGWNDFAPIRAEWEKAII